MFREMRRKVQQLPQAECEDILQRGITGMLAVIGDDGYPYAVPQNYVYLDGKIYLHGAKSGHKVDAVRNCDKVSFCVIDREDVVPEKYATNYVSVMVFGRAGFISDEERKYYICDKLAEKYRPGFYEERKKEIELYAAQVCIIEITPEHISGKEALELSKMRKKRESIN